MTKRPLFDSRESVVALVAVLAGIALILYGARDAPPARAAYGFGVMALMTSVPLALASLRESRLAIGMLAVAPIGALTATALLAGTALQLVVVGFALLAAGPLMLRFDSQGRRARHKVVPTARARMRV
ncbi:MAG: hypothetical protein NT062_38055 [Proteobacteria bacterium]|nr:hypothetical protein [Pseudomonadota bacterium]